MYNNIQEIRFLPNDKSTFPTFADIEFFLSTTMVKRGGVYNYPGLAMKCKENTLVFFQYDGALIAAAVLSEHNRGKCYDEEGNEYKGHYVFDMETMKIFKKPILAEKIRNIDSSFNNFSQCKRIVDLGLLDDMIKLIEDNI